MPGVSSLLRSAQSAAKKVQSAQDAMVSFNWENSAQTYEDFVNYSNYLNDRLSKATDPSTALSYQSTLRSARRSYTSNEIQRAAQDAQEGNGSTQTRMDKVKDLYFQALDNGDLNLAQNLHSQYDSLNIQLQNEQKVAADAYAAAGQKGFDTLTRSLTKGYNDVTLPTGETVTPLAAIADHIKQTGDTVAGFKAAADTMSALAKITVDAYQNATSQEQIDKLEEKYGPGLKDLNSGLTFNFGGKNLTFQDVTNADANAQLNNPIYGLKETSDPTTGEVKYTLKENNVDTLDYVRQMDANGQESYVPIQKRTDKNSLFFGTSDQGRGLSTQITDNGEIIGGDVNGNTKVGNINAGSKQVNRDASQSIGNRLKALGIEAVQNGTTLKIKLPGENVERIATIQPDGSIRYSDGQQIFEIGLVDRNLGSDAMPQQVPAGQIRAVAPDETSDFGQLSPFGGVQSQASQAGKNYIDSITGKSVIQQVAPQVLNQKSLGLGAPLIRGPINIGNDFSGTGSPATSSLLQSALFTGKQVQLEAERQQFLQQQANMALQSTNNFNLNQTPVSQFASNGVLKKQLQVAAPAPLPRVYVAPPPPTPKITSVGVAQPTGRITVGVAGGLQGY